MRESARVLIHAVHRGEIQRFSRRAFLPTARRVIERSPASRSKSMQLLRSITMNIALLDFNRNDKTHDGHVASINSPY